MKAEDSYGALIALMVLLVVVSAFSTADARKIRTRHSIPKDNVRKIPAQAKDDPNVISIESDSLEFVSRIIPSIRFYGFDKNVGSAMESFFITNNLDSTISGLNVRITYTDLKGRQLHRRDARLDCELPPHETIRTDIKSWDTQKSFYYHRSLKPKRQATPFDVRIELLSIILSDKAPQSATIK